ncbi:alpha/beta hydrolase family protein [Nocardioides sp. LML1-1-1.1]|uniref:alpha/beta hydrolase family protein n=1 Tax=Nocardioides sp. LML1-1-1.1 TaxID=3135248 RepID=UPI003417E363
MRRRTVLGLAALGAAGAVLTACGEEEERRVAPAKGAVRHDYGPGPSQYGELHLPEGTPRGVVVVVHGGFWRSQYDAGSLGTPLARDLARRGWAAWNLEYRRVGPGLGGEGGAPATFDDVAAGIDLLATLDLDTSTVVTLGHSAGGHLATWAAGRGAHGWSEQVPVTHVVSQAGVLDLRAAARDYLGAGAVKDFLGHEPTTADARYDPAQQLPLGVPVWCVHGTDDANVPLSQSVDYVARAQAAGGTAELVEVAGDHFVVIDPASPAWARQVEILDGINADARG